MNEKMKKKKPTYSVFSNFVWSLKKLLKYSKTAFFLTALFIPINIGIRYLEIYLPSLVVSEVTNKNPIKESIFAVGIVLLLIMIGYAKRFSTDCFSDYFNDMAKKSKMGLHDYLTYQTEKATVEELKMQNSYFINGLYKR